MAMMNKQEFLTALKKALSPLSKADLEERLSFYSEMIDDRIEEGLLSGSGKCRADSEFFFAFFSGCVVMEEMDETDDHGCEDRKGSAELHRAGAG
jgi:hypothetical protein